MSIVFFTDRDLGIGFADILDKAGFAVERHRDHFAPNCSDVDWLRPVGQRGWIALTHDRRIRYKPNELRAVMQYKVALLVIIGAAPFSVLAHSFVVTFPAVQKFLSSHTPPFIAKVYRPSPGDSASKSTGPGRVELWYPK